MRQTIAQFHNGHTGLHVMKRLAQSLPGVVRHTTTHIHLSTGETLIFEPSYDHELYNIMRAFP